jgi:REP element-mobilizing transposase RayT
LEKPVIYHCMSRVVERRLAFGADEKEKFRTFMRMTENFSGCRVLTYCLMGNHFHLLLEVPPMPEGGLNDDELLKRLRALYSEAFVAEVAKELAEARMQVKNGSAQESVVVGRIHERFTHRMHDLSEFMKTLLQRFTIWFNRSQKRTGNLWEDAYKSVIVEDGVAARTMAAYIDLNPVRAGICKDPADYRWSGYGEAMGRGVVGDGKKARAGLVRAWLAHKGVAADSSQWEGEVAVIYRITLLEGAAERLADGVNEAGNPVTTVVRKGMGREAVAKEMKRLDEDGVDDVGVPLVGLLRQRVRYFTQGVVIGSRSFVDEVFHGSRERFGPKRKDGARKLRGDFPAGEGSLWSLRDLKRGFGGN